MSAKRRRVDAEELTGRVVCSAEEIQKADEVWFIEASSDITTGLFNKTKNAEFAEADGGKSM